MAVHNYGLGDMIALECIGIFILLGVFMPTYRTSLRRGVYGVFQQLPPIFFGGGAIAFAWIHLIKLQGGLKWGLVAAVLAGVATLVLFNWPSLIELGRRSWPVAVAKVESAATIGTEQIGGKALHKIRFNFVFELRGQIVRGECVAFGDSLEVAEKIATDYQDGRIRIRYNPRHPDRSKLLDLLPQAPADPAGR